MSLELHLDGLWASPLADAAVRRFEIEWTDDIALLRAPPAGPDRRQAYWALKSDFKIAWGLHDLKSVAGIGLVLHRARAINDSYRERLAEALLAQDRFAEAHEALAASAQDDHAHWFLRAWALAGLGDFGQARDAIRQAAARLEPITEAGVDDAIRGLGARRHRPDLAFGSLAARGESLQHLEAGRPDLAAAPLNAFYARRLELFDALLGVLAGGSDDWETVRDEVAGLLVLGVADRAADRLTAALDAIRLSSPDQIQQALYLANAAAATATGERPTELLRAARNLFGADADRAFVEAALAVLEGEAPWARLTAAEWAQDRVQLLCATVLARSGHPEPAIALLGRFVLEHGERQSIRRELVVCCGQVTMGRIRLDPKPRSGPPRTFDIFPYNGELEVLKIKLHEMSPWVDQFVIFEANQTYTGRPKPIFLPDQSAEIAEFLPKIIHLVVSDPPPYAASAWAREYHQRDESVAALQGLCAPDDLVLLTDADEIVDRRRLEGFRGDFAVLKKAQHRYFLNYRRTDVTWQLSGNLIAMRARHLKDISYSVARTLLPAVLGPNRLERAGWHFTSVGDAAAVFRKLGSSSHEENVHQDGVDHVAGLLARIRAGQREPGWERCDLDALPAYVRDNRERLADLIL